jgi:endoglucanase
MISRLITQVAFVLVLAGNALALPDHFLKIDGASITDQNGEVVPLRGVNTAWLHMRGGGTKDNRIDSILANRFGVAVKNQIMDAYLDNWITTDDLDAIAGLGMNIIRVPFSYKNFYEIGQTGTTPDADGYTYTIEKNDADAFRRLDWIVNEAAARGIYCMLDFHNFQGGVGDPANPLSMLVNTTSQANARRILQRVATRYLGNPWVAGYDLVNEPYGIPTNIYRSFHDTIRAIDPDHIIFIQSWDWFRFPNTTTNSLSKVACSLHFYPNLPNNLSPTAAQRLEQVDEYTQQFRSNRTAGPGSGRFVPIQIGEFNMSGDRPIEAFEDHGATWTMWSWKDVNHGNQAINNIFSYLPQSKIDQINALDLWNDSPEEIIAAFVAMRSPSPFTQFRVQGRDQMASPIPVADALTTPSNGRLTISAANLTSNDQHLGANAILHAVELSDPPNGTITPLGDGWIYQADNGFTGTDSFTYKAYDLYHRMVSARRATVTIQVTGSSTPGPLPSPPTAPTGLSATPVSGSAINLSWVDASDNETHFIIERKTPAFPHFRHAAKLAAGTTTWQDTRLASSTTYQYRIRATHADADSADTGPVTATTLSESLDVTASAPFNLTAVVRSSGVTLAWTSHAANETGFAIQRKTGENGTYATVGTTARDSTTWQDTTVLAATRYFYRVHAFNDAGQTNPSAEVTADTPSDAIWIGPDNGLWSLTANWSGSAPVSQGSSNLTFNLTGSRNTNNDLNNLTVFSLSMPVGTGENIISGNPFTLAGSITSSGVSSHRIDAGMMLSGQQTFHVATNGRLAFHGSIQNGPSSGGIVKTGGGALTLGASNSFTGSGGNSITFSGSSSGSVILAHASALPATAFVRYSGGGSGVLEIATDTALAPISLISGTGNGGTLLINRATPGPAVNQNLGVLDLSSVTLTANTGTQVTSGTPTVSFAEIRMSGGNDNNPVTVAGNVAFTIGSASITNNGFPKRLRLDGTHANNIITGIIADTANSVAGAKVNLIKSNTSTWHLKGNNTYTGDTTVSAGTLKLDFPCLNDNSVIRIDGTLHLNHPSVDAIGTLHLGGVLQPPGIYNASNSNGLITGIGSLRVGPASAYSDWAQARITAFQPNANFAPGADPDQDGVNNCAEFAFRGDPLSASSRGTQQVRNNGGIILTLAIRKGNSAPFAGTPLQLSVAGISYTIQGSQDLIDFSAAVNEVAPLTAGLPDLSTDPDYEYRSFRMNSSGAKGFLRAKAEQANP